MKLDPEVAAAIAKLAERDITVFIPQGKEHLVSVDENGDLVIISDTPPVISEEYVTFSEN